MFLGLSDGHPLSPQIAPYPSAESEQFWQLYAAFRVALRDVFDWVQEVVSLIISSVESTSSYSHITRFKIIFLKSTRNSRFTRTFNLSMKTLQGIPSVASS